MATNQAADRQLATAPNTGAVASTLAKRDANANLLVNNLLNAYLATASAAGTLTLTVGSAGIQYISGVSTHTIVLPAVSTLALGHPFIIFTSGAGIQIQSSGGNVLITTDSVKSVTFLTCIAITGTGTASWVFIHLPVASSTVFGSSLAIRDASGNVLVNTAAPNDNSTKAASTAYVDAAVAGVASIITGSTTLVAGTVTITHASAATTSKIWIQRLTTNGNTGAGEKVTRNSGNFVITSMGTNGATTTTDLGTFMWFMIP